MLKLKIRNSGWNLLMSLRTCLKIGHVPYAELPSLNSEFVNWKNPSLLTYLTTFKNLEFIATIIVLSDIKTAPTAGLRRIPRGNKIPAARGIAMTLYPVAQPRFRSIFL